MFISTYKQGFGHSGFFGVQSTLQSANLNLEWNPFSSPQYFWSGDWCTPNSTPDKMVDWSANWSAKLRFALHSTLQSAILSNFCNLCKVCNTYRPWEVCNNWVQSGVLTTPTERRLLSAAFTLQPSWNDLTLRTPPGGVKFLSALQNWPIFRSATPKRPVYMRDYSPNCLIS